MQNLQYRTPNRLERKTQKTYMWNLCNVYGKSMQIDLFMINRTFQKRHSSGSHIDAAIVIRNDYAFQNANKRSKKFGSMEADLFRLW